MLIRTMVFIFGKKYFNIIVVESKVIGYKWKTKCLCKYSYVEANFLLGVYILTPMGYPAAQSSSDSN